MLSEQKVMIMSKIIELPIHITNQIKAGEIVERPVSVVKELVENAIDANSTQIDVLIEEGGLSCVQVIDNGDGITSEDVLIAFKRHATSKMTTLIEREAVVSFDRMPITTLGFRGEALPSIAAVSKVTLNTTPKDEQGTHVVIEGGQVKEHHHAIGRQGTSIEVRDLFYNTPARLKFMTSLQTEVSKIADLMNRLALGHPNIAFSLTIDGNQLLKTTGNGQLQQAIANVYTPEIAKKMVKLNASNGRFHVGGYACLPEVTRARKQFISLFLNGRYIKNFQLVNAVIEGYETTLMGGRFPIAVITIDADFELIDVNAHPTKETVRISQEQELIALIQQALQQSLMQSVRIPNSLPKRFENEELPKRSKERVVGETQTLFDDMVLPFEQETIAPAVVYEETVIDSHVAEVDVSGEREDTNRHDEGDKKNTDRPVPQEDAETIPLKSVFPQFDYFGQMHGTYLFAQNEKGLYVIDQHAAQERIKYEHYRVAIGQRGQELQTLLVPIVLDYPSNDVMQIQEHDEILRTIGIHLEPFGQNSFMLSSHPVWMKDDIETIVRELIDLVLEKGNVSIAQYREDVAIMMSCKKSIKANHYLDDYQARSLLNELSQCDNPYNCPHGRPVIVHLSTRDIEKLFKRIV